jgi:hypothetical protein
MTAWSRTRLPAGVTLSRSEGSLSLGLEMLGYAQHDSAATQTNAWINLFMYIIAPTADLSALFGWSDVRNK